MRALRSKSKDLLQSITKPFGLFDSLLAIVGHIDEGRRQLLVTCHRPTFTLSTPLKTLLILISPLYFVAVID